MNKIGTTYKAWNFSKNGLPQRKNYAAGQVHIWIICGLFNDAVNSSDNIQSNDVKTNEEWIGKHMGGKKNQHLIWGNTPALAWQDWGKSQITSEKPVYELWFKHGASWLWSRSTNHPEVTSGPLFGD
jgi:acyl-CoA synthetase (AMP-forming)/AMP-acid ligase II